MQATAILTEEQISPVVQSTPQSAKDADLLASTPDEEYEAWLGELAMWQGYFDDKGVL